MISEKDKALISILSESLKKDPVWKNEWDFLSESEIYAFGLKNNVSALLFRVLQKKTDMSDMMVVKNHAQNSVGYFYRLLQITAYAVNTLQKAGLECFVLKGVCLSRYYHEPETRTFSDIDILIRDKQETALAALEDVGFTLSNIETSKHHIPIKYEDVLLELHVNLTSDFDNENANALVNDLVQNMSIRWENVLGIDFPMASEGQILCAVIIHMLQHFLTKGLGIKLLCDWVLILRNGILDENAKSEYLNFVKNMHIKGFSDMVTCLCLKYLGLEEMEADWLLVEQRSGEEEFFEDILMTGSFGNIEGRMVTARKPTFGGLLSEFHHQMKVNHPKASKCFLLWPVLWVVTFIVFMKNNKRLGRGSAMNILATAKKRGEMAQSVALWRE